MTARRWLALAALLALLLLGGRIVASMWVEYRWHEALGAGPLAVWRARVTDLAALRLGLALAGAAFLFANFFGVSTSIDSLALPRRLGDLEISEKVPGRQLLWGAAAVAVFLGVVTSLLVDDWMSFDLVEFARPFGVPEPYTSADLGFFVFWLPLENALYVWAIVVLFAASALVVVLYALTTSLSWEGGRLRTTRHVRRHLTALAGCLLLVLAWGHRLDAYALLYDGSGPDGAFVYADHQIGMRSRFVLATLTAVAALAVFHAGWQAQGRVTFWVISAILGVTVVLRGVLPVVVPRVVGAADVARRNVPYLRNRASMTQTAYAVNRIRSAPGYGFAAVDSAATAIPLWDPAVLARGIERTRRGDIVSDDVGWQAVGGRLGTVALTHGATEPEGDPLTWGIALAAGAVADGSGGPILLDSLGRARPLGIGGDDDRRERRLVSFPHAAGHLVISDTGGRVVADPIGSFGERLAHAWDERDLRLLFSDAIDRVERPALVRRRDVGERLAAVAPFFAQGQTVVPALARDTLYWVCHLYAASETFPLSQRYAAASGVWSYFQHAAVGVVNAETGAVMLIADPSPDRLTDAWVRRFPTLFSPPSALPAGLVDAIPPATDGVLRQAWALSRYGSRGDRTGGPVHAPRNDAGDSTLGGPARALGLMPAALGGPPVPGWTLPLLDGADRVAGVLVALGGADPTTLWVPQRATGPRWSEVMERLRALAPAGLDAADARELTRGRTRVVPIDGQLAYVQPMYVLRSAGQPSVAAVAAVAGATNRVAPSIGEALGGTASSTGLMGSGAPIAPPSTPERLRALYDAMRGALRRGDWTGFGAALDSLGSALGRLSR